MRPIAVTALVAVLVLAAPASATITVTAGLHADGGNGQIYIARDDGSHKRSLGAGDASVISPDGKLVAVTDYPSAYPGTTTFKLLRSTGGAPLLTVTASFGAVTWAPDSRTLAGLDDRGRLVTIDVASGAQTAIAHALGDASFSPDSKRLAFATPAREIKVVDLATRATSTLRRHADSPLWGKHGIAFGATHKEHGQTIWNVATIRPDGTHFRQLTHIHPTQLYFGLVPAAWSANGKRLATDTMGSDGYWNTSYVVDAVHGGARLFFRGLQQTTISHNGRWIIGQTGDAECCGFQYTDVVRVPWSGGKKHVLVRHAMSVSSNG
jgi:Tol biopolymer transport system component